MDFMRAVSFPYDDDEWPVKFIVGTLLSLIPFFGPGYQVRVARRMIRGERNPLPRTDELGQVFVDGLMAVIAGFVYFLPMILVACVLLFPALVTGNSSTGTLLLCVCGGCVLLLALLYTIPAFGLYWTGVIRYAETGNFSSFMQFGALWRDMMANFSLLFTTWLYAMALGLLGALVSPIAAVTIVGIPLLVFYYQVATGHLIGQAGLMMTRGGR
jgi:hypothetical protein